MAAPPTRKLAVILHADVVDSTALVQRHEQLAHERFGDAYDRLAEIAADYGGVAREVRGDALVAEFERASDAVCAALAFQAANGERNAALGDDVRPMVRVGIAMGEVIVARGTVTGAGVVLAQRLEQLADAGGVVVQGAAYETIPRRLPFEYTFLGEREVKGFEEPVRAFSVQLRPEEAPPPPEARSASHRVSPRRAWLAGAAAAAITIAGVFAWWQPWVPREEAASLERMAHPLPENPSIAVLPFDNLTGDSSQEYVSDGLSEDIITTLSRVPGMFVIARNSTFAFKGESVQIQRVAEELGVRYVVEGSYQRDGDQVRVHAQLIDALSGRHLWAERLDRTFSGVFALQDDITQKIVSSLSLKLTQAQEERVAKRYTTDVDAYDYFLRGHSLFFRYTRAENDRAREMYRQAIDLDPAFARAHAALAMTYATDFLLNWSTDTDEALGRALALAEKSVQLDPALPQAQWVLGIAAAYKMQYDRAAVAAERSITLDPNYADAYALLGYIHTYAGRAAKALPLMRKAMRLSPRQNSNFQSVLGRALFYLGHLEEARSALSSAVDMNPTNLVPLVHLAGTHALLGDLAEADWLATQVLALDPGFTISTWPGTRLLADERYRVRLAEGLRDAGLPD